MGLFDKLRQREGADELAQLHAYRASEGMYETLDAPQPAPTRNYSVPSIQEVEQAQAQAAAERAYEGSTQHYAGNPAAQAASHEPVVSSRPAQGLHAQQAHYTANEAEAAAVPASASPQQAPSAQNTNVTAGPVNRELKTYDQKQPVDHAIGQTKIIAILNQKGGVGKSTTAVNLSAALGALGKSVLLIDIDPQGNATSGLGIDKTKVQHDTYDVLISGTNIREAIIPDVCKGLDALPATIDLAGAEVELVNEMARENRLKNATNSLRGTYDYVFIDCPPSLGLLTVNALVAADKLLIPIQCEFYALEGVTKLLESMKRVKNALNPSLDIFGVLLTMYDSRTTLSRQVADEVRKYFGVLVFDTMVPRTVKLSEAPSYGQPITEYDPSGKGAEAYWTLAEEVIRRG